MCNVLMVTNKTFLIPDSVRACASVRPCVRESARSYVRSRVSAQRGVSARSKRDGGLPPCFEQGAADSPDTLQTPRLRARLGGPAINSHLAPRLSGLVRTTTTRVGWGEGRAGKGGGGGTNRDSSAVTTADI